MSHYFQVPTRLPRRQARPGLKIPRRGHTPPGSQLPLRSPGRPEASPASRGWRFPRKGRGPLTPTAGGQAGIPPAGLNGRETGDRSGRGSEAGGEGAPPPASASGSRRERGRLSALAPPPATRARRSATPTSEPRAARTPPPTLTGHPPLGPPESARSRPPTAGAGRSDAHLPAVPWPPVSGPPAAAARVPPRGPRAPIRDVRAQAPRPRGGQSPKAAAVTCKGVSQRLPARAGRGVTARSHTAPAVFRKASNLCVGVGRSRLNVLYDSLTSPMSARRP